VRLPIGSQHAPDLTVLDQLSELIRTAPANAELIFNCQMGRGRTSMLMVCAVLLCNFYRNIPLTPFTLPVFTVRRQWADRRKQMRMAILNGA